MAAGKSYPLSLVIKAVDQITAPLNRISARISAVTRPIQQVSNSVRSMSEAAGVPRLAESFRGVARAADDVGRAVDRTALRIIGIGYAGKQAASLFNREFVATADLFERLDIQLEGLFGGDRRRSGGAMDFLKRITVETPFEMPDLAKSFRTMLGFGLDPMTGALQAIVDQTAKIGGTGEDLTGIAMQLGQAWSKGRLQAQDANILVERGVPVWAMLSRAVERVNRGQKVSIGQLRKMSEDGQLGTKAISLLIQQMGIEGAGASKRMMKTWTGMISNLADQWTFFKVRVMRSGPFEALKGRVQSILDAIDRMTKSGELDRWADRIGTKFLQLFNWLEQRGPAAWRFMTTTVPAALTTITDKLSFMADLMGGWDNLAFFALAGYIGGPLVSSVIGLTVATINLGIAMGLTPVGWLIGGLVLLGIAGITLMKKWDVVKAYFSDLFASWKQAFVGLYDFLAGVFTFDLGRVWKGLTNMVTGAVTFWLKILRPVAELLGWIANKAIPVAERRESTPVPTVLSENLRTLGTLGPALGVERMMSSRGPVEATSPMNGRITVDFRNVPPGTRVTKDAALPVDLSWARGLTMAESH